MSTLQSEGLPFLASRPPHWVLEASFSCLLVLPVLFMLPGVSVLSFSLPSVETVRSSTGLLCSHSLDNQIPFLILIPLHTHCQYIIVCGRKPFLTKSETENRQKSPRLLHSQKLPDCTTWEIRWARRNSLMFWMLCSGQGGISQISVFCFKPGFPVIPLAKRQ